MSVYFPKRTNELKLSRRAINCLNADDIVCVGDLVQKTERDLLRLQKFGRKSLNQIKEALAEIGLHLRDEGAALDILSIEDGK